jgi:hypothetical protein
LRTEGVPTLETPLSLTHARTHARTRTRTASDGVTAGEKAFMYGMALMGFFFILCAPPLLHSARTFVQNALFARRLRLRVRYARLARSGARVLLLTWHARIIRHRWMKREAVSETRRRVTKHLREIDTPVNEDNWIAMAGASVGQY